MNSQHFLVFAPDGEGPAAIIGHLKAAGMTGVATTGAALLAAIAANRLGGVIATAEALAALDPIALDAALAAQEPGFDCPLLVLTRPTERVGGLDRLGNVTILERPVRRHMLAHAARQALRQRGRQYAARAIARTVEHGAAPADATATTAQVQARDAPYRLTIELGSQLLWSADEDDIGVGKRWAGIVDLIADSTAGGGGFAYIHPEDVDHVDGQWQQARNQRASLDMEFRLWLPDHDYRWHRARAAPHCGAGSGILRWYGTIEDVEDRHQAEIRLQTLQAQLIHLLRTSAMGTMASTLAHELNQPLTATVNFLRGCRRLLEQDRDDRNENLIAAINSADRSAARAGDIVRRLREMVTRRCVARRPENLATVIHEACALALIDVTTLGIACRVDIADDKMMVDVDRIQIQQVLINLLRNALEAVEPVDGGEIVISTRSLDGFSEIVVRDNGPGFSEDARERLFEAFNSSKADGMGIGLSISRTIVEMHGGQIALIPTQGTGAAIRVTIPNTDDGNPVGGAIATLQ